MSDIELYKAMEQDFTGDKALFWAGKMSSVTKRILSCNIRQLSGNIALLEMCMQEYDNIIFNR